MRSGHRLPTISHHIAKLKEAGSIRVTEEGTRHYYALDEQALRAVIARAPFPTRLMSQYSRRTRSRQNPSLIPSATNSKRFHHSEETRRHPAASGRAIRTGPRLS